MRCCPGSERHVVVSDTTAPGAPPTPSSRWRTIRRLVVALIALGLLYVAGTGVQVWLAPRQDQTEHSDAIVVLGAAQYNGTPSPALRGRLDHAYGLWSRGMAPTVVVTGFRQPGDRSTEAKAGFDYLRGRGIPEADLLVVDTGTSTWESLAAAKRVMSERGMSTALMVTDPYHALRVRGVAGEVGIEARMSLTETSSGLTPMARETVLVSAGRIIGYRRAVHWFE